MNLKAIASMLPVAVLFVACLDVKAAQTAVFLDELSGQTARDREMRELMSKTLAWSQQLRAEVAQRDRKKEQEEEEKRRQDQLVKDRELQATLQASRARLQALQAARLDILLSTPPVLQTTVALPTPRGAGARNGDTQLDEQVLRDLCEKQRQAKIAAHLRIANETAGPVSGPRAVVERNGGEGESLSEKNEKHIIDNSYVQYLSTSEIIHGNLFTWRRSPLVFGAFAAMFRKLSLSSKVPSRVQQGFKLLHVGSLLGTVLTVCQTGRDLLYPHKSTLAKAMAKPMQAGTTLKGSRMFHNWAYE